MEGNKVAHLRPIRNISFDVALLFVAIYRPYNIIAIKGIHTRNTFCTENSSDWIKESHTNLHGNPRRSVDGERGVKKLKEKNFEILEVQSS